jgi:DNA-binding NtrC family response regulator/tetratricopeptide (TPR) repeat protein
MNPLPELIGESPGIQAVRQTIGRLLQRHSDARRVPPILIQGETGTGKGLLARAIHETGPRKSGPFVDVNCAAIPETLLEAELFGFERGAFTDARNAKPGLFQTAHHGTLFLDEIGLLPEGLQSKLLTVIEERAVRRLGSTRNEPVDVWIITASNEDLAVAIQRGRFREDLYHRLAVLTLWLPPLRDRSEDILRLAEHFLARACADYGLPPKALDADARTRLLTYRWPGNVRELANTMERVALLSEARLVTAETLGLPETSAVEPPRPARTPTTQAADIVERMERERDELLAALVETNWNVSRAAARLGVPRNTVRYRIEKYGLRPGAAPAAPRRRPVAPVPSPPSPVAPAVTAPSAAAPPAPAPAGVRWERRRLALLRAGLDVPPDTDLLPDATRTLEALVEKIESFGGRVEELAPTGIVAAFGLEPVEDAPARAAHAAMAMQKVAERTRRGAAERGALRLGIHAGWFLIGQAAGAAEIDLDAKRDAWAVLQALVAAAPADGVLVSGAAASFLERRFGLVPIGAVAGAQEPAFRLAGLERTEFKPGGWSTRFVGRRHDLELLENRLASVLAGHGQVVGIAGEAGIGKSRLLFEFRQGLAGADIRYLEGQCHSYGSTIPYLPALDVVRSACGITEADTPEAIVEKARSGIHDLGLDPEESAPYLLRLLGVKEGTDRLEVFSPEAVKARTFETLRHMCLSESRRRPLVLTIENLHWIDTTSEELITSLVEGLAVARILLLVTHRPGYRPPWIERSYATQIALQPLPAGDSLTIVQSVLQTKHVPEALAQIIVRKAEGNPFFLEELSRTVVEFGSLPPALAVPDTVQEVLLTRIERLPDEPKRLLQTASVLGREVSLRLLGAIWQSPPPLEGPLRELTRLEFLYEQDGGKDPVYVFKHALTREVARDSVPISHRLALHAAAGRALETLYADRLEEASDRLAYHYSKAKQADKAIAYLTRFAEKAARSYAHVEAAAALTEGLAHVDRLPAETRDRTVLDLALRLAHSLSFLGRFREIRDLLLGEQGRLARLEAPALAGPYHFWLAHTYSHLGDHERASQSAERALEAAGRAGDPATMGRAYVVLAQESYWSGQPLRGVELGGRAAALLEEAGDRWWLGLAHWVVGINYVIIGDFEQALDAETRALAIGDAIGDPRIQSYATWSTGWIHALTGEWEAGIEACNRGLGRSPDPVSTAVALGHLGYIYLEKGDPAEAIPLLEQAVAEMSRFQFRRLEGRFTTFLGEAYLLNGELAKARELVQRGLEITRQARYWYGLGWAQQVLGRIARAGGQLTEAEAQLTEALQTFATIQARFMTARTHLALAELAHARGNSEAAATYLRGAYSAFRSLRVGRYVDRAAALARELAIALPD